MFISTNKSDILKIKEKLIRIRNNFVDNYVTHMLYMRNIEISAIFIKNIIFNILFIIVHILYIFSLPKSFKTLYSRDSILTSMTNLSLYNSIYISNITPMNMPNPPPPLTVTDPLIVLLAKSS